MDPFYRYKIPIPILIYERNFTLISNINSIAKSLMRDEAILEKYLTYVLCTQGKSKKGVFRLNGHFKQSDISEAIDSFRKKFVECPTCSNPETIFHRKSKAKCKACGSVFMLPPHKLTNFISKHNNV